ncbi:MAG: tetratricopeptide repeat protein [Blastomonas sp.]
MRLALVRFAVAIIVPGLLVASPALAQNASERRQVVQATDQVMEMARARQGAEAEAKAKAILFRLGIKFQKDDSDIEDLRNAMAFAMFVQGRYDDAAKVQQEIYDARKARLGKDHPDTLYFADGLAGTLNRAGRSQQAEQLYREIIESYARDPGPEDPLTLDLRRKLAATLSTQRKYEEADTIYADVFATLDRIGKGNDRKSLNDRVLYGMMLGDMGEPDRSIALLQDVMERQAKLLGEDDPATLTTLAAIGNSMAQKGDVDAGTDLMASAANRIASSDPDMADDIRGGIAYYRQQAAAEQETAKELTLEDVERDLAALAPDDDARRAELLLVKARMLFATMKVFDARRVYEEAVAIAERSDAVEPNVRLSLFGDLRDIYRNQGNPALSLKYAEKLVEAHRRYSADTDPLRLSALNSYADALRALGRYADADAPIREARDGFIKIFGAENGNSVSMTTNLAVNLDAIGRHEEAEGYYRQAVAGWENLFGREVDYILPPLNGLAYNLKYQGKYEEAERLLREELAIRRKLKGDDDPDTIYGYINLGRLFEDQGLYSQAESWFSQGLSEYLRTLGESETETLDAMDRLGINLKNQGKLDEAEALLRREIQAATDYFGEQSTIRIKALNNLGRTLEAGEDFEGAEALYREALEIGTMVLGPEDSETLIYAGNLGASLLYQNRWADAEPVLVETLEARTRTLGPEHPQRLYSLNDLALLYFFQGRYADALPLYEEAIPLFEAALGRDHPFSVQARSNYGVSLISDPDMAEPAYANAYRIVESLRSRRALLGRSGPDAMGLSIPSDNEAFYFKSLLDAAWNLGEQEPSRRAELLIEAVRAAQEAMDGPAGQAVAESAARSAAGSISKELESAVRERRELVDRWTELGSERNLTLAAGPDSQGRSIAEIDGERDRALARIESIDATIKRDFPQYFQLIKSDPVPILDIIDLMEADEALLLVLPSEFGTHVISVTADGANWNRAEISRIEVNALVKRLLWDVGASVEVNDVEAVEWASEGEGAYPFDRRSAYALYAQLIAPVESALAGKSHVFIAAGGSLSSLPFGLLVTEPPEGADGDPDVLRATKWFADAHALIQIPSLQSLQFLRSYARAPASGPGDSFTGFGDPVLEGKAETRGASAGPGLSGEAARAARRGHASGLAAADAFAIGTTRSGGGVVDISALKRMARLPGTARELEAMRSALGAPASSIHTGSEATEAAVRSADLSNTRILALATHGLMAGEVRGAAEPGLVFTPPETPGEADDGLLTASEVAALRLNADWVILSACNTAAGDGSQGAPGLSGLARAFFYAGARNLLASHWPVRDDVAARITVRTLEIARDDPALSRAQAFTLAMREIRMDPAQDSPFDTLAHPNAWAPFTLIGDGAK